MNDLHRVGIIFTALVVVVLGVLGIKNLAEDSGYKNQVRYTTAIRAEDKDRFNYAVDSQQGNLLVHGVFKAEDKNLVKFPEMTKAFTFVERVKEHYTRHESCSTDSDGHESCTTYYTWDAVDWEHQSSPELTLYDRQYPAGLFKMDDFSDRQSCEGITKANAQTGWFSSKDGCDNGEYYLDSNDRYVYNVVPQSFSATFIANSLHGGLKPVEGNRITLQNKSIDQTMKEVGQYKVWAFWIAFVFIVLLVIGACVGAYYWVMEDGEWSLHR